MLRQILSFTNEVLLIPIVTYNRYTDENGNSVLTLAEAGTYTVSAVSDTMTLVPPVCIVTVTE